MRKTISKFNKKTGFTLAELMILMAVLTVLMAAFAPIFTAKYKRNADTVWSLASNDSYSDIYSDGPAKSLLQQSFVGLTPTGGTDVRSDTYAPYSKLFVRSVANLDGAVQKQLEFRENGTRLGYLFAGNNNLLLGGQYKNLSIGSSCVALGICADGNTAFGAGALNSLTTGYNNTAIGTGTLSKLTNGNNNTAIGIFSTSGESSSAPNLTFKGNVFVGNYNFSNAGNYNTLIGNDISVNTATKNTTVIGSSPGTTGSAINVENSDSGVAVGSGSYAKGTGNTVVGAYALKPADATAKPTYNYITAVGYNSCSGIANGAGKTTCVGEARVTDDMSDAAKAMYNDGNERVLIGGPVTTGPTASQTIKYAAPLEVHHINGHNTTSPIANLAAESVVINGNLIVRGQPYLLGRSPYPFNDYNGQNTITDNNLPALMGMTLLRDINYGVVSNFSPLMGDDGFWATKQTASTDNYKLKSSYKGHEHCICSYACSSTSRQYGTGSYDWSSFKPYSSIIPDYFGGDSYYTIKPGDTGKRDYCGNAVTVNSYGGEVILDRAHGIVDYGSCCPILTGDGNRTYMQVSDRRLKNVGQPYKLGLDYIDKINVYNYKFKFDSRKQAHVGVIAQDLKDVLPDAVEKNKTGYYTIRWENIFYTAVNAIKELNFKIHKVRQKIAQNYSRLKELKKKNTQLEAKLEGLAQELDELEAQQIVSKCLKKNKQ